MRWPVILLLVTLMTAPVEAQSYRPQVTSDTSYYVRTDGNDTACTGLSDAAYVSGSYPQACATATWQAAITIIEGLDFNNHTVTIKAGEQGTAETFSGGMDIRGLVGGGKLDLKPSSSGTTIIGTGSNDAIGVSQSQVQVWVGGLTLQATGGGYGTIEVTSGSLYFDTTGPTFGNTTRAADIWLHENLGMVQITNSTFAISGNQNSFIQVTDNSHAFMESSTLNLIGTPRWGAAFIVVTEAASLQYVGNHYIGTATGLRFSLSLNGVLNTEGDGVATIPGSQAGVTSTGGVYDTQVISSSGQMTCSLSSSSQCTATKTVGIFAQCTVSYDIASIGYPATFFPVFSSYDPIHGILRAYTFFSRNYTGLAVLNYTCSQ